MKIYSNANETKSGFYICFKFYALILYNEELSEKNSSEKLLNRLFLRKKQPKMKKIVLNSKKIVLFFVYSC